MSPQSGQRNAAPRPLTDADSSAFWRSIESGRLELARCRECSRWEHPALECCRECGAPTTFEAISGRGSLHSWTVIHRASVPGHETPYVIAIGEFEEQSDLRLAGVLLNHHGSALRAGLGVIAEVADVDGTGYDAPTWRLVDS
jgi:uncharacterized protein